ncbi:MAG TPA: biopolymer transporter ExbD [Gemmatimonadaceae bacterium]|nr:biopolymer transporter ExbD [Gemmatimonadaceae bacterium]
MSRRRRAERTPLNAEINVVSLIDVMMLLMVIFMITAPIMQGGVDVKLPNADVAPLDPKSGLVVTVDRTGQVFVDDTKMSFEAFSASFKALAGKRAGQGVYLRADQGALYGQVVRVMSVMRKAGVSDIGMVAEPLEAK